jgi:hypothetical protein
MNKTILKLDFYFFIKIPFLMTRFFNLEALPLKGSMIAFWFSLSIQLLGQTAADIAEMPR